MIGRTNMGAGKEEQVKSINISSNGTFNIIPDADKVLSRVTAVVNVASYIPGAVFQKQLISGKTPGQYTNWSFSFNVTYQPNSIHSLTVYGSRYTKNAHISNIINGQLLNSGTDNDGNIIQFLINSSPCTITITSYNDSNMGIAGAPIPNFNVYII